MPTNVTAEYKKAEQAFRDAHEPRQRLLCLKEMLRTIPKHKGTEHLQADIKSRIKQLSDELAGPKKGGKRSGPSYTVRPEGAAQIALLGPPNSGKSTLHERLTGAHAEVGPYPFTTKLPLPGMLPYGDVHFQLVDLPPISDEYMEPWLPNTLRTADAAILVIDISDPACVEQAATVCDRLQAKKVVLQQNWPGLVLGKKPPKDNANLRDGETLDDPFAIHLPTVLIANKSDLDPGSDEVDVLEELLGVRYPALTVSAQDGTGLGELGPLLFQGLRIARIYTRAPGKEPDDKPFTVRAGDTIADVARLVHRDMAATLKYARVWGSGRFDGQHVGPEHPVNDGDIVELHGE